jgi:hypothetical protein
MRSFAFVLLVLATQNVAAQSDSLIQKFLLENNEIQRERLDSKSTCT